MPRPPRRGGPCRRPVSIPKNPHRRRKEAGEVRTGSWLTKRPRADRVSTGGRRTGQGGKRPGGRDRVTEAGRTKCGGGRAGGPDRVSTGGPRSTVHGPGAVRTGSPGGPRSTVHGPGADGRSGQGHLVRSKTRGGQGCCAERPQSQPQGAGDGPRRVPPRSLDPLTAGAVPWDDGLARSVCEAREQGRCHDMTQGSARPPHMCHVALLFHGTPRHDFKREGSPPEPRSGDPSSGAIPHSGSGG